MWSRRARESRRVEPCRASFFKKLRYYLQMHLFILADAARGKIFSAAFKLRLHKAYKFAAFAKHGVDGRVYKRLRNKGNVGNGERKFSPADKLGRKKFCIYAL